MALISIPGYVVAAPTGNDDYQFTHYVADKGSIALNTTDDGPVAYASASNISTPCSIQTAMSNASAGDVVGVRGGTYAVGPSTSQYVGALEVLTSGISSNVITYAAYTGESPVLNGQMSGSEAWGTNGVVGCSVITLSGTTNYIVLDGFSLQCDSGVNMAKVTVGSGDGSYDLVAGQNVSNIEIKNCTFNGGSTNPAIVDNAAAIRINKANNITISNNEIYDYLSSTDYDGPNGILSYGGHSITINNNHIHDCSVGVYAKSYNREWNVYNNFIHTTKRQAIMLSTGSHYISKSNIYNNICYNFGYGGIWVSDDDNALDNYWNSMEDMHIYNNTCIVSQASGLGPYWTRNASSQAIGFEHYNNIAVGAGSSYGQVCIDNTLTANIFDYNLYDSSTISIFDYPSPIATSLATLQSLTVMGITSGNHNQNSLQATPVFTNANGDYSEPSDFALTNSSPGYLSGNDGEDIGADVSLVGVK